MTPADKLREIEETLRIHNELAMSDNLWLIARVKHLQETLEFYANGWVQKPYATDKKGLIHEVFQNKTVMQDHGIRARKALETDE